MQEVRSASLIDLDAIKKEQVALQVQAAVSVNKKFPAAVLPDGYKIIELDHLNESPNHFKDHRFFSDLDEWSRYLADNLSEGLGDDAVCFINADNMQSTATLDRGTPSLPGHCFHKASLTLKPTPEYVALDEVNGGGNDQKKLAEWVEDWAHCITGVDTEGKAMDAKQIVHSIRNITTETTSTSDNIVGDFEQNRSVLEKVESKNKDRQTAYVEMNFKPFDDLNFYNFTLRVSNTSDKDLKPRITLRCVGLEMIKREMAQEFKNLVNMRLDKTPIKVYVGQ